MLLTYYSEKKGPNKVEKFIVDTFFYHQWYIDGKQ